jgi:hypothetical protein
VDKKSTQYLNKAISSFKYSSINEIEIHVDNLPWSYYIDNYIGLLRKLSWCVIPKGSLQLRVIAVPTTAKILTG